MYSNYFSINKNFQSSVNLELDFNNESKIDEYIPTSDICDVLKKYIKTALGMSKDKATTLIGPYGKGKSFLLLVLTFLLGNKKETKSWENLVEKIGTIDSELFDLLQKVKENKITLLPIIINSNYDNITQSFQIALNDALRREGMESIIPNSAYDICISLLDKWCSQETIKNDILSKCLDINKLTIKKLKKGLESYSPTAYKQFEKLYNCVNIGLDFNPLISNDIVKTYSDIAISVEKYGYNGLFIIFDEFSKFIESNTNNLMIDLKIIQDMAELCTRSTKKNQIHLCCVAHKSIVLYEDHKNRNYALDSFKTVDGRFKEVRFNRSIEENYQIIAYAIRKTSNANDYVQKYIKKNDMFYSEIERLSIFSNHSLNTTLFYGCFPLNPLTAYSLIQISEYSAQNERTLFTFLADTDEDSFNSFIHNNDSGLFNVDKIYDYFSPLLQKEETNYIRNIWYRTESILSKLEDQSERRIIKALSIILMINDLENLPSTEKTISLSLCMEEKDVLIITNRLIEKHYLRKNILNNLLSFALSNTKQIDEAVELLKKTKFKSINYSEYADIINEHKFILPRKYNEINKIVRFFKVLFLDENAFFTLKSLNYFFENNYCDGLVVYLLRDNCLEKDIIEKVNLLNDKRLIVKYPMKKIDYIFYQSITRYACLNEVKRQKGLDEITINEIDLLLQETETDVKTLIGNYYDDECSFYSINKDTNIKSFNLLTSIIMDDLYPIRLIFNNELINKKVVTTQYQKAINHVIDWLLDGENEFDYSVTSPETSIKLSILDNNNSLTYESESARNFRTIIEDIKNQISRLSGKRIIISEMLNKYLLPPYGIREGVLPIILAKAISELSDNIVLYYQSKEIELNSTNIVKSLRNEKYQISFSKGSLEQRNYLKKLLVLFDCTSVNNFRKDSFNLATSIKSFFVGLPQIIRLSTVAHNYLQLDEEFISYKNIFLTFNLNPYEAIFEDPKEIFKTKKYDEIYQKIKKIVKNRDALLTKYKLSMINKIKNIFSIEQNSSLKSGISDYISNYVNENEKPILEPLYKTIYETIFATSSYDDFIYVSNLAKCIVGHHIEDWDSDKMPIIVEVLMKFANEIRTSQRIDSNSDINNILNKKIEISGMASLLKNNMESVLEDFSGSVSANEKIAVLSELLRELL